MLRLQRNTLISLLLILILIISACGGGTYGTGGPRVTGTVKSIQGDPLAGVIVSIDESGATTITNDEGIFELESSNDSTELTLSLTTDTFNDRVMISEISNEVEVLEVNLMVDLNSGKIDSVDIQDKTPQSPQATPATEGNSEDPASDSPVYSPPEEEIPDVAAPPGSGSGAAPQPGPGPGGPESSTGNENSTPPENSPGNGGEAPSGSATPNPSPGNPEAPGGPVNSEPGSTNNSPGNSPAGTQDNFQGSSTPFRNSGIRS